MSSGMPAPSSGGFGGMSFTGGFGGGRTLTGSSSSTSTSFLPNYPEEAWLLSLSQAAGQHSEDLIGQAANTFAGTSALTNEAANNFLNMSQQSLNQANQMWGRYTGLFQPEEDQLLAEARQYASVPRIQLEMGKADAQAAQSADAAREASLQQLRDYGVNVDSGRFAGLDRATQAQKAASVAAAQNQAREATEAAGRAMRSEAIQVGERYPGQVMNALQQAQAGQAGAVNATMANARAFGELMQPGLSALQIASSLKYPPLGSQSQSSSSQFATGSGGGSRGGGGSSGGGGSGGGGTPRASWEGNTGGGTTTGLQDTWPGFGGQLELQGPFGSETGQPEGGPVPGDYPGVMDPSQVDWAMGGGGSSGDGGGGGGGGGWAAGGPVLSFQQGGMPTTGGFVSQSLSPSDGTETDDIPARLNANEFVIPRDVATWKGHEFFQNLIDKSRKARMGGSAKPTFQTPQQGPQPNPQQGAIGVR